MIAARSLLALVVHEVRHHALAVFGAAVLVACVWAALLAFAYTEQARVLPAIELTFRLFMPFFILFLADRLIGRDYADGTHEHLATLPIPRLLRPLLLYVLGAGTALALAFVVVDATALIATRIEGIPALWLLQLHAQVALVVLGWWGAAFALAWTGRWRWVLWWTGFVMVTALDEGWVDDPWRRLLWVGPLVDSIDQSRSAPPWSTAPVALAWALGGLAVGLVLSQIRQGAVPARMYARAGARARSVLVLAAILAIGVGHFFGELAPEPDPWSLAPAIPARAAVVRPLGGRDLHDLATGAAARLDALAGEIGVDRWPAVVLQPSDAVGGPPVRSIDAGVLAVDARGDRQAAIRAIITDVLDRHTGQLAQHVPGLDEVVAGAALARWPDARALARVAEVGDPASSYRAARRAAGVDAAEALAASRIRALDGPGTTPDDGLGPAATCLLRHALGPARRSSLLSSIGLRWAMRGDPAVRVCGASRSGPASSVAVGSAGAAPAFELAADEAGVFALFERPAPTGSTLRYQQIDPLELEPRWGAPWRVVPAAGKDRVDLGLSASAPAAAELVVSDGAGGFRSSGLRVLRPGGGAP